MKLGRNESCWCGSGKKYKRCHLGRHRQEPVPLSKILSEIHKAQGRRMCLHPVTEGACKDTVVKAHTVPLASLRRIAQNGHVYHVSGDFSTLTKTDGRLAPELIGIKKASTFTGFCSYHDHMLFRPFETGRYESLEQASFLLGYRALCLEVFKKLGVKSLDPIFRQLDRGRDLVSQMFWQKSQALYEKSTEAAIRDLREEKARYDQALVNMDYSDARYLLFELANSPEVMCSTGHDPEFDFAGKQLQDLSDPAPVEMVSFSAL